MSRYKLLFFLLFISFTAYGDDVPHNQSLETQTVSQVLTQLRFIGLSFEDKTRVDYVLDKLVEAHLLLRAPLLALKEIGLMNTQLARGISLEKVGAFYLNNHLDRTQANELIQKGFNLLNSVPNSQEKDSALSKVVTSFNTKDGLIIAMQLIGEIKSIQKRIHAIAQIQDSIPINSQASTSMIHLLSQTSEEALKNIKPEQDNLTMLLQLAYAQSHFQDFIGGKNTLNKIQPIIEEIQNKQTYERMRTALGTALVYANDSFDGMTIIKSIHIPSYKIWGLSHVAHLLSQKQDMNSARPLIDLAIMLTDQISDEQQKFFAYQAIIYSSTRMGLLNQAYRLSGKITRRDMQEQTLAHMAMILIQENHFHLAEKLLKNISYFNLRVPIFLALAQQEKTPQKKSSVLLKALVPETRYSILTPEETPNSIEKILLYQYKAGDPKQNHTIAKAAKNLETKHDDQTLINTRILMKIATFLGKIGDRKTGNRMLNTNWPLIWIKKQDPYFDQTLLDLIQALLALNRPMNALNVAAQIPSKHRHIQDQAFNLITSFFAFHNNTGFALQTVNHLTKPDMQMESLGNIILYFTHYVLYESGNNEIKKIPKESILKALIPTF